MTSAATVGSKWTRTLESQGSNLDMVVSPPPSQTPCTFPESKKIVGPEKNDQTKIWWMKFLFYFWPFFNWPNPASLGVYSLLSFFTLLNKANVWRSLDISASCWQGMSLLPGLIKQPEGVLGRFALMLLDYLQIQAVLEGLHQPE